MSISKARRMDPFIKMRGVTFLLEVGLLGEIQNDGLNAGFLVGK